MSLEMQGFLQYLDGEDRWESICHLSDISDRKNWGMEIFSRLFIKDESLGYITVAADRGVPQDIMALYEDYRRFCKNKYGRYKDHNVLDLNSIIKKREYWESIVSETQGFCGLLESNSKFHTWILYSEIDRFLHSNIQDSKVIFYSHQAFERMLVVMKSHAQNIGFSRVRAVVWFV